MSGPGLDQEKAEKRNSLVLLCELCISALKSSSEFSSSPGEARPHERLSRKCLFHCVRPVLGGGPWHESEPGETTPGYFSGLRSSAPSRRRLVFPKSPRRAWQSANWDLASELLGLRDTAGCKYIDSFAGRGGWGRCIQGARGRGTPGGPGSVRRPAEPGPPAAERGRCFLRGRGV